MSRAGAARHVVDGVFMVDPPVLLGARCLACDEHHFPRLDQCPYCGHETVEAVNLSNHGTLWGWTTVVHPPPGYLGTTPYGFGVVELPEGVRVITRLSLPDDQWEFGQPMTLHIVELGEDDRGDVVTTWEFAP